MDGLQIVTYALGLIFIISFVVKVIKIETMPIHLRWELYPIAGETKKPWGGSYLEETEWWNKSHDEKSLAGELRYMGQEILYFREYFHRNRSLWYIVYPFHIGIFMLVGFFALLVVGAILIANDVTVSGDTSSIWGRLMYYLTLVTGVTALVIGTAGCLALLIRKVFDSTMKPYTRRIEYFNIVFVLAVFLTGLLAWSLADSTFATAREYVEGLITFDGIGSIEGIIVAHILLLGLFLAYLPHTNMMHFFMKHFTYNSVRWDDKPHLRGSNIEQKLEPLGDLPINWAAPHIQGIRNWSDIAKWQMEYTDGKEVAKHARKTDKTE